MTRASLTTVRDLPPRWRTSHRPGPPRSLPLILRLRRYHSSHGGKTGKGAPDIPRPLIGGALPLLRRANNQKPSPSATAKATSTSNRTARRSLPLWDRAPGLSAPSSGPPRPSLLPSPRLAGRRSSRGSRCGPVVVGSGAVRFPAHFLHPDLSRPRR